MLRVFLFLLALVVALTVLRGIVGIIAKAVSSPSDPKPKSSPGPLTGELKRDPVCGTYVPAETAVTKRDGESVLYFCSTTCRDKHV